VGTLVEAPIEAMQTARCGTRRRAQTFEESGPDGHPVRRAGPVGLAATAIPLHLLLRRELRDAPEEVQAQGWPIRLMQVLLRST